MNVYNKKLTAHRRKVPIRPCQATLKAVHERLQHEINRSRLSMNVYNMKLTAQGCFRHLDQSGAATERRDLA